jgi:hypothetical protein
MFLGHLNTTTDTEWDTTSCICSQASSIFERDSRKKDRQITDLLQKKSHLTSTPPQTDLPSPNMTWCCLLAKYSSYTFGALCIISAAPFLGFPFQSWKASDYYTQKNLWLSRLSGDRLSLTDAEILSAALRVTLGVWYYYAPNV